MITSINFDMPAYWEDRLAVNKKQKLEPIKNIHNETQQTHGNTRNATGAKPI